MIPNQLKQEINNKIYDRHIKHLNHLNYKNDVKLFICFSAPFAAGKTTIATKLEKQYKAIRINNDDIRKIIDDANFNLDTQHILIEYLKYLLVKISKFNNKLIVIDSSIDRKYKMLAEIAKEIKYNIFVIKIKVTKIEIMGRSKKRIKSGNDFSITHLNDVWGDYKHFNTDKINFVYNNNFDELILSLNTAFSNLYELKNKQKVK